MCPTPAASLAAPHGAITPLGDPSSPALIDASGTLSHGELADAVAETAEALAAPRTLAVVKAARDRASVTAYLGAMAVGHVVLLTDPDGPSDEVTDRFVPGLSFDGATWEHRDLAAPDLHPDLALLLSTSGTTGSPKLVRLSHDNLRSNAEAIAQYLGITAADRALATLPLHYCYGLSVLNSHLVAGAAVVLTDNSVVDPCTWKLAGRAGVTSFAGVPHTFSLLERGSLDRLPHTLRLVTQAGGRLPAPDVRRWAAMGEERGFDFIVMYGQTEATARMAWLRPELASSRPDAIGEPIPGGSFRLDGDELVYSGPNVMLGYAASRHDLSLGRTIDELHTGDLARRAPDGLWEITGRRSRFAKPFGLRVDLERLEQTLTDDGITACCMALERDGAELLGCLVQGDHPEHATTLLAAHTGLPPGAIRSVGTDAIPRTSSGKVDSVRVEELLDDAGGPAGEDSRRDSVSEIFEVAFPGAAVGAGDTFVDLGGDSLSYVEVSMELETALGRLPADWHLLTVEELEAAAGPPRRLARVEIGGVLRTLGILMVVGRHVELTVLGGGAHVLMALSGHNFSRFPLTASLRDGRFGRIFSAMLRVAVPTALWLAAVVIVTGGYSWANVGFLNAVFGPDSWGDTWRYWYLEALVQILAVMALVFCIPAMRRAASRFPFALPLGLSIAALTVRFGIIEYGHEYRQVNLATGVAWLFLLGWAAHRAGTVPRRLLVTAIVAVALPGWFGEPMREVTVAVAMLAIIWLREVPVPRQLAPTIGTIGGASMWIYLTHWQVYPPLEGSVAPLGLLLLSILTGVLAQKVWDRLVAYSARLARRIRRDPTADTSSKRPDSIAGR